MPAMPARLVWQLHRRQAAEVVVSAGVVAGPAVEAGAGGRRRLRLRGTRLLRVRIQCPLTMAVAERGAPLAADKVRLRRAAPRSGRLVRYRRRAKRQLILSIFGGVMLKKLGLRPNERRLPLTPPGWPFSTPHQIRSRLCKKRMTQLTQPWTLLTRRPMVPTLLITRRSRSCASSVPHS